MNSGIEIARTVSPAEATPQQIDQVTYEYNRAASVPQLGGPQLADALGNWVSDANAAQRDNG